MPLQSNVHVEIIANCHNYFQKLPATVLAKYNEGIPNRVYVQLPTGDLWRGSYVKERNCIEGLHSMFRYYSITQFHFLLSFTMGDTNSKLKFSTCTGWK